MWLVLAEVGDTEYDNNELVAQSAPSLNPNHQPYSKHSPLTPLRSTTSSTCTALRGSSSSMA